MKLPLIAAVLGLGISTGVSAANTAVDQQVDQFFKQGIKHCKNAMDLSRTSVEIASAEFDRYESYIGKVEALKPELKEDVMVKRQMEQCDQVGHDIARNKALPVFEESMSVCKEVKTLVSRDYLTKAKSKFVEYRQMRDKALSLTDTVLKVGSNASKARRCDRMEDRIIAAEQRIKYSEIKADRLVSTLRKSTDSCLVSSRMLERVGGNLEKLNAAEEMLSQAKGYFQQTQNYPEAIARSENFPGYESSKKIRQYMVDYGKCEQDVFAAITQQKETILASRGITPEVAPQVHVASVEQAVTPAAEVEVTPVIEQTVAVQETVQSQQDQPQQIHSQERADLVEEALVQVSHEIE